MNCQKGTTREGHHISEGRKLKKKIIDRAQEKNAYNYELKGETIKINNKDTLNYVEKHRGNYKWK